MNRLTMTIFFLALLLAPAWGEDGFGDIFTDEESSVPGNEESEAALKTSLSGSAGFELRYYFDRESASQVEVALDSELTVSFGGARAEGSITFSIEHDLSNTPLAWNDLIDTASLRAYLPFGFFELGLLKTEWGKGDGIHAVDPLNPLDHRTGIKPDLNEMKQAVPMARLQLTITDTSALELTYVPVFTPMLTAATGRWALGDFTMFPPFEPAPDTHTLQDASFACRVKAGFGPIDFAASYYYGFLSQPGYRITTVTEIVYTRAQLFGIETGFVAGPFTFMAEGGFWLTDDPDGTDPALYNNRFVYLAGFDFTIPSTEAYISVQVNGQYVFESAAGSPVDVDAMQAFDDLPTSHTVVAALDWPFARETFKLRIAGLYAIEAQGFLVMPSFSWIMTDDVRLSVEGQIYGGKDFPNSLYSQWDDNDSLSIGISIAF